ncbi:hypothetical protein EDB80DRAFT_724578 [Ilyonectria destructans]|nr:hypothetical protein EDB80DRAFT_724578 [Ilyonectria destructans]
MAAMRNDKSTTSVEDLPVEILRVIFSHFCHHCCLGPLSTFPISDQRDDVKALKALTHVSTSFRSVALPILFHNPTSHVQYYALLQALDRQPDLAQCVKVLYLPTSSTAEPKNLPLLERMAEKLSVNIGSVDEPRNLQKDLETDLLMSLCPKVEHLEIHITDDEGKKQKTTFGFLRRHLKHLAEASGFSKLRFLEINSSGCNRFSVASRELSLFLRETPLLETLVLKGTEGHRLPDLDKGFDLESCRPALQSLTTFQVTGWSFHGGDSDTHTLSQMIALAPNLKAFTFSTDSDGTWGDSQVRRHHMPPTRFIEILKPRQGTLQYLSLDFGRKVTASGYQYPALMMISTQQMRRFASLQTLELDISCFCRHLFGRDKMGGSFEQKICLTELLPLTVRHLTIRGFEMSAFTMVSGEKRWHECWQDLLHIGERAMAGDFPGLQRVQVHFPTRAQMPCSNGWDDYQGNLLLDEVSKIWDERRREFKAVFKGSGVETGFKAWYIWEDIY